MVGEHEARKYLGVAVLEGGHLVGEIVGLDLEHAAFDGGVSAGLQRGRQTVLRIREAARRGLINIERSDLLVGVFSHRLPHAEIGGAYVGGIEQKMESPGRAVVAVGPRAAAHADHRVGWKQRRNHWRPIDRRHLAAADSGQSLGRDNQIDLLPGDQFGYRLGGDID